MRPPERRPGAFHYLWMATLLLLAPLGGVVWLDLLLAPYLEFPPATGYVVHAPFFLPIFLVLLLFVGAVCFFFVHRLITFRGAKASTGREAYPFPWWGRLGIIMVTVFWVLAWSRFLFFESLQRYTFFPLWLGCILTVNGLSCGRQGTCLLRSRPRFFLALFPASALFWWYFEYLNRFVGNWYYLVGGDMGAAEYVIHATVCFSTVLPAVASTDEFLGTFPRLTAPFREWRPVSAPKGKGPGLALIGAAAFSLALLAVFPDILFPLVWISPLLVLVGFQLASGRPTVFDGVREGDWRRVVLPALAALVCGLYWETWNWKSLAHWQYSIPFVHRFQIFAMPLPGYSGYLPFGLQCAAAAALISDHFSGSGR
ncbi:MAG TPA: hypothetical protein ENN06_09315 [Desulfobacteraceae bacterium]|nr:hypothetical protein [Desulfobacteraceae bacterium]